MISEAIVCQFRFQQRSYALQGIPIQNQETKIKTEQNSIRGPCGFLTTTGSKTGSTAGGLFVAGEFSSWELIIQTSHL